MLTRSPLRHIVAGHGGDDRDLEQLAGTYSVTPARIEHRRSVDEVLAAIRLAGESDLSVKAIGSGHSFTDIGVTRGTLLYLDRLRGRHRRRPGHRPGNDGSRNDVVRTVPRCAQQARSGT